MSYYILDERTTFKNQHLVTEKNNLKKYSCKLKGGDIIYMKVIIIKFTEQYRLVLSPTHIMVNNILSVVYF